MKNSKIEGFKRTTFSRRENVGTICKSSGSFGNVRFIWKNNLWR